MMPIALGLVLLLITGCEHLVVYEEDTAGVVTGKVAARTLLGLATIGLSEAGMATFKEQLEERPYPVTSGFHTIRPRSNQPVRVMVMGKHPLATAEAQRFLAQSGAIVVERVGLESVQAEQRLRLLHTADHEADLVRVGKLTGADHIVFVETTTKPTLFKMSIIRHLTVSVRGVDTVTGRIIWQGNGRYRAPIDESDSGLGTLTTWGISRALCHVEEDWAWIEPGPYRKRAGCVKALGH